MVWFIITCLIVFGGMCIIYSYFYLLFEMLDVKHKLYLLTVRLRIKWNRYKYIRRMRKRHKYINSRRRKHEKGI